MSPCPKAKKNSDSAIIGSKDQLKIILETIGAQTEEDIAFISSDDAVEYYKQLVSLCKMKVPFESRFKKCSKELIDLLRSMLEFNPGLRPTAKQLLANKIFDNYRN